MIICDYFYIYFSVVYINADIGQLFSPFFSKINMINIKLWISSINSVRKLQILYLVRKNKEIKKLKSGEKNGPILAFIYTATTKSNCYRNTLKNNFENSYSSVLIEKNAF